MLNVKSSTKFGQRPRAAPQQTHALYKTSLGGDIMEKIIITRQSGLSLTGLNYFHQVNININWDTFGLSLEDIVTSAKDIKVFKNLEIHLEKRKIKTFPKY